MFLISIEWSCDFLQLEAYKQNHQITGEYCLYFQEIFDKVMRLELFVTSLLMYTSYQIEKSRIDEQKWSDKLLAFDDLIFMKYLLGRKHYTSPPEH